MKTANYGIVSNGYRTDGANWQGFVSIKNWATGSFQIWFSDDNSYNAGSVRYYVFGY